jgi:hypothetical protein
MSEAQEYITLHHWTWGQQRPRDKVHWHGLSYEQMTMQNPVPEERCRPA